MTKFFSKKNTVFLLVLILFLGLFFVNVGVAQAQFQDALRWFIKSIFWLILYITQFFTGLIAGLFTTILNFGFKDMRAIHVGWTISRDIVNMFFILGLIVIAFATILRIESYGMKTLLVKFVIAALFINFSYLACGIIIDSSQVVTNYFIRLMQGSSNQKPDIGMALLDSLAVTKSLVPHENQGAPESSAASDTNEDAIAWQVVINVAFSAIIIGVAGFALLVGCLLLFIRMGTLWALMILVPFAWFFNVFPGLNQHFKKWWSEFIKWTFFAPIYVFFIYLILQIGQAIKDATFLGDATFSSDTLKQISQTNMMSNWTLIFNYVLLIILLYGATPMALSMGGKAASIGMGLAKGTLKGAYKLPGRLRASMVAPPGILKAIIGEKASQRLSNIAKYTTPSFWKEAAAERKKELQRGAGVGYAKGKMHDIMNRVLSLGKERTSHAEEAEQFEVAEEGKKVALETNRDSARLIAALSQAINSKNRIRASAALQLLYDQNDHNDLLLSDEFSNWNWTDKSDTAKADGLVGKAYGKETNSAALKDFLFQAFQKMGVSEEKASPLINNFSHVALAAGNFSAYHMTATDETGRQKRSSDKEQAQIASTKYAATSIREKGRKQHPTTFIKEGWDKDRKKYTYKGLDPLGIEAFKSMTKGEILQTRYAEARPDRIELEAQVTDEDLEKAIKQADEREEKYATAEKREAKLWTDTDKQNAKDYFHKIKEFATQPEKKKEEKAAK